MDETMDEDTLNTNDINDFDFDFNHEKEKESDAIEEKTVIWGTTIAVDDVMQRLREFFLQFKLDSNKAYFPPLISQIRETQNFIFNIDSSYILKFDINLYRDIILYPQEMITLIDVTINELFREIINTNKDEENEEEEEEEIEGRIQIRLYNLIENDQISIPSKRGMRALEPQQLNTLISLKGMITRCSPIIPDMREAFFLCSICSHTTSVSIDRGYIKEPPTCATCNAKWSMKIIHNRSIYADKQLIRLQETPDSVPEGETPQTVNLCVYDQLVDQVKPGDRVEVTGIYRTQPIQLSKFQRNLSSVYKTYVDVIHFQLVEKGGFFSSLFGENDQKEKERDVNDSDSDQDLDLDDSDDEEFLQWMMENDHDQLHSSSSSSSSHATNTIMDHQNGSSDNIHIRRYSKSERRELKEKKEKYYEMVRKGREEEGGTPIYDQLVQSLAPSIWQLDDVKKGILCLLFGGEQKKFSQSGEGRFRSEINVLLIGDPGTSKSQLLQFVHKISPRGIYTSGKGSSAVGLTAYITKDPDTRQTVLESGALVLSDKGVCCIDEFDKMSDQTRSILHEAMEQQTVSIAKSGIICTLNARTSILASANPKESRYNPKMSVVDNIDLPPTLLSRFDLIYLVLDKPNVSTDKKLAKHLVSLYYKDQPIRRENIDLRTLSEFISFARRFIHPVITDPSRDLLVDGYVKMRKLGGNKKTITATPRQLESLIRLSEGLAKMRLSPTVDKPDVEEAIRLMKVALQQAAIDPHTGTLDMDLIQTGRSASSRHRLTSLSSEIKRRLTKGVNRRMLERKNGTISFNDLFTEMSRQSSVELSKEDVREALKLLEEEESITLTGDVRNRIIKRTS